jgi:hypothetical protein
MCDSVRGRKGKKERLDAAATRSEDYVHQLNLRPVLDPSKMSLLLRCELSLWLRHWCSTGRPQVKVSPTALKLLRVRPKHVLGVPSRVHSMCEHATRNVADHLRQTEGTVAGALKDLLGSLLIRETGVGRTRLSGCSSVGRHRDWGRVRRMCAREGGRFQRLLRRQLLTLALRLEGLRPRALLG